MNKSSVTPGMLLFGLCVAYLALLLWSAGELPERVATHFGFDGHPDKWTTRSSAVALMGAFGLGLPLLMVAISVGTRFMPVGCVNVPNREYWLAPERRDATFAFLSRQLLWLACLVVCLMAGMQWLMIYSNTSTPVRMPTKPLLMTLGIFLAGMAVWVVNLMGQFRRPPTDTTGIGAARKIW